MDMTWLKGEDLGVILADRGMFEDHMPTNVISTLKAYHKQVTVSSKDREQLTNERVEHRRRNKMFNEIRSLIEQRDIFQLERGSIRADSIGSEDVDGAEDVDDISVSDEVEGVDSRQEVERSQEADWVDGLDISDGTEEAGVIVIESRGEERSIEVKTMETHV